MFGPNKTPSIHHREDAFKLLYENLTKTFAEKFNVSDDFVVVPITGSGTLAIEIVIKSLQFGLDVQYKKEEFGNRLNIMTENNVQYAGVDACVLYETSKSVYHDCVDRKHNFKFLDCISAFPYYDVPKDVDVWVTVNSKALGVAPGLSFIVLHKKIIPILKYPQMSYLSLSRYLSYAEDNQTPNTPAIELYSQTLDVIKNFDVAVFREKINNRRRVLQKYLNCEGGEGPVFTIKPTEYILKLKKRFNLYGKDNVQIFLWSGTDGDYNNLFEYLEETR